MRVVLRVDHPPRVNGPKLLLTVAGEEAEVVELVSEVVAKTAEAGMQLRAHIPTNHTTR